METSEQKAIARCQGGEIAAFGELYDAYIKKIYDFVYYKTLHKETAEDLVSLIFTKAMEKIGTYRGEQGAFSSWLYRIARNTVIDHYRTHKKEKNVDDVWDLSGDDDIERDTDARAQLTKVEAYLQTLSAEQRDIIIMRLWQGMSHAEIADALGKQEGAIKVAYSRAMKELRKNVDVLAVLLIFAAIVKNS